MDLIGRVGYIENRLGERKPDRRGVKSVRKPPHEEEDARPEEDADRYSAEQKTGIGRVIDVSA
jgi:hypothetical protein